MPVKIKKTAEYYSSDEIVTFFDVANSTRLGELIRKHCPEIMDEFIYLTRYKQYYLVTKGTINKIKQILNKARKK